ncbi:MAG: hypothetical protein JOZ12_07875 [Sinobacteraceae bacterium]|nr:hypothetical protein [Nevskiaceae bacterium]MBV8852958.1 hypothetical protein [Nevskiaceae bacterium]MBV9911883.1 hypothetical protein [Nevskiaceae bacterium]
MARKFHASSQARNATKFNVGMQLQLEFCRFDATAGTRAGDMLREMRANIESTCAAGLQFVCSDAAQVMFVEAIG